MAEQPPLTRDPIAEEQPVEEKPVIPEPVKPKTGATQPFTIELETAKYLKQTSLEEPVSQDAQNASPAPQQSAKPAESETKGFARELETAKYFNQRPAAASTPKPIHPGDLTLPVHPMHFAAHGVNNIVEGEFRVYLNGWDLLFVRYSGPDEENTKAKMLRTFESIGGMFSGKRKLNVDTEGAKRQHMLDAADEYLIREICEKEIEGSFLANAKEFTKVECVPPPFWANLVVSGKKFVGTLTMTHETNRKLVFQIPTKEDMMTVNAVFPALFGDKAKLDFSWRNKN